MRTPKPDLQTKHAEAWTPNRLASWGSLIAEGAEQMNPIRIYWWLIVFPGGVLVSTLLALNFLGDGLRDAWDVRSGR